MVEREDNGVCGAQCFKSGWEWGCGCRGAQSGDDVIFAPVDSHQNGVWRRPPGGHLVEPPSRQNFKLGSSSLVIFLL